MATLEEGSKPWPRGRTCAPSFSGGSSNREGSPHGVFDSIRQEMNKAGQKAPELSERLWRKVARRFAVEEPPCAGAHPESRVGASRRRSASPVRPCHDRGGWARR